MNILHKRLFLGLQVQTPWPDNWPEGRIIQEPYRHITLAFLGNVDLELIMSLFSQFPFNQLILAPGGYFYSCGTLPEKTPNVFVWFIKWFEDAIYTFRKSCMEILQKHELKMDEREWLAHLTVCRKPFDSDLWMHAFHTLPFFVSHLHLYESLGHSEYSIHKTHEFVLPFQEIEHTADLAFHIYGKDLQQIYLHAFLALAFRCPDLLTYFQREVSVDSLEDGIILLNEIISYTDGYVGCPFKAVSFHGEERKLESGLLQWEMIVDV